MLYAHIMKGMERQKKATFFEPLQKGSSPIHEGSALMILSPSKGPTS